MKRLASTRTTVVALSLVALATGAQASQLPAPATTGSGAAAISPSAQNGAGGVGHGAEIVYSSGLLEVVARGSSLNQILREISRQTGLKITGGIADDVVFGRYGPAAPPVVLAKLLEGTGSRVVLKEAAGGAQAELILTPRGGGATPLGPGASQYDASPREPAFMPLRPTASNTTFSPPASDGSPSPSSPEPSSAAGQPGAGVPPAATAGATPTSGTGAGSNNVNAAASGPASPNGVKTPQQIFQELQQLQQQQAAPR